MDDATAGNRLDRSAVHLLHRAGQSAGDIFAEELGPDGLTPRQFAILVTVNRHEGLSQADLVQRTGIDRSTLADIIRRMISKGLLQRRRTETDARAYSVRLTSAGREALHQAEPAAANADHRLLATLSPHRRGDLLDILTDIVEGAGERDVADRRKRA